MPEAVELFDPEVRYEPSSFGDMGPVAFGVSGFIILLLAAEFKINFKLSVILEIIQIQVTCILYHEYCAQCWFPVARLLHSVEKNQILEDIAKDPPERGTTLKKDALLDVAAVRFLAQHAAQVERVPGEKQLESH